MDISILSVFPDIYDSFLQTSLVRRAADAGVVSYNRAAFSDFVKPGTRIDAPTFGHGAGMLIKPEVVQKAIEAKEKQFGKAYKIFFSPHGKKLDQPLLKKIATKAQECGHLMVLPARYEGMDARVEQEYADEIISVGDFVLMGGDVPAMMLLEGVLRFVPGVVGKAESVEHDSFTGPFVDHPEFTEPVSWKGHDVPDVIRSGNHAALKQWRQQEAVRRTVLHHFDWVREHETTAEEKKIVHETMPPHYVVLMHGQVMTGPEQREGTTSVTSIDVHDIARSSRTFGVKNYFVVTPLTDQQKIVEKLLTFWQTDVGIAYNPERHEALKRVRLVSSLDDVIAQIEKQEGKAPLLVTTSARFGDEKKTISYHDQSKVWQQDRPVLLVFGTGRGLADSVMQRADFVLVPVEGFSDFNHLSVRSAVAIILDRWLGANPKIRN